jgi:hypothetical protein
MTPAAAPTAAKTSSSSNAYPVGTGKAAPPAPALFSTAEPNRGFAAGVKSGLTELLHGRAGEHAAEDAAAAASRIAAALALPKLPF